MLASKNTVEDSGSDHFDFKSEMNALSLRISRQKDFIASLESEISRTRNLASYKSNLLKNRNAFQVFANSLAESISSFSLIQNKLNAIKPSSIKDDSLSIKLDWEKVSHYIMLSYEAEATKLLKEKSNGE